MAQLLTKISLYCEAKGKSDVDFKKDVLLQDDGNGEGVYIKEWNVDGVTKPTDKQIASYETAGNEQEALSKILEKRKKEYLSWNEQFDKLWHDINDGKLDQTGSWYKHIKSVKDSNSKE